MTRVELELVATKPINVELGTFVAFILQDAGHRTSQAVNGIDALRMVYSGTFDLVITDLYMPEKEGLETIGELRRKYPVLRIIAMSGGAMGDDGKMSLHIARKLGATLVLKKPFSEQELIVAVTTVLGEKATGAPALS